MSFVSSPAVAAVDDDHFPAVVLESSKPVIVDFWAAWCPPCRVMSPILGELAEERDDLAVVTVDIEANQETAARYGVLSMPTFIVFRDGAPILTLVGSRPKHKLVAELEQVL